MIASHPQQHAPKVLIKGVAMYVCRACVRRASTSLPRQIPAAQNATAAPLRTFATTSFLQQDQHYDWSRFEKDVKRQVKQMPPDDREDFEKKTLERMRRATKKELQLTTDPYHIADNVLTKLKGGDFEKALLLTREASRDKQCVVSWNHLIEHEFRNKKIHSAIKLYHEMKKRAQLPNAQTFTIIFKGCAASQHPTTAVGEAVKIYNTMLSSSRLKPNVIHLNAVLDVCARAQDIESMFVILRSADKLRAPNNLTYTIILNALRHQKSNHKDLDGTTEEKDEAVRKSVETTLQRAGLVWDEVMSRWKKGEIIMDEELMCARCRILLLGGPQQTGAVLSLISEILDVPRLDKKQPAAPKASGEEAPKAESEPEPRPPQKQQKVQGPSRPIAGNNTLSVIMRALGQDRRTKLAAKYWDIMTQKFNIVPDKGNYLDYLETLTTGNSSGKAARMIQAIPAKLVDEWIIKRGLLLCHFDTYNLNAFENATVIFDSMLKKMRVPDAECMKLYLQISTSNNRKYANKAKYRTVPAAKIAYGHQMYEALDRVWEPMRLATNDLTYSAAATSSMSPEESWKRTWGDRTGLLDVARKFVAVSDKILSQGLIPTSSEESKITIIRRKVMNDYIFRIYEKQSELNKSPEVSKNDGRAAATSSY
ncbi:hypothetical protein VP1G_07748 [Cytospora mali]|uniref:Pentatricopeptide repeat-containing protein 2, mitochondrial n=1 Tax=Cytospora mali TaxID=578113 RepID=A0A194V9J4_CYTMA|nr:hypothetical protein VP1G_07748 [Valsa mali var. pyri (nom. inval.)]